MEQMTTLTFPNGQTYEIHDKFARDKILKLGGKVKVDYNGSKLTISGTQINFKTLLDLLEISNDFVVLAYNNRAYHVTTVQNVSGYMRYITFASPVNDSGISKNSEIQINSNDGVNIAGIQETSIANENINNKVSEITNANKEDENNYTSVKAVVEYIENGVVQDITNLKEDFSELSDKVDSGIYIGEMRNWFNKDDVVLGKRPDYTVGASINTLIDNPDGFVTKPIAINAGDIIRCNTKWASFTFYDVNGLCLTRYSQDTITYTAPSNAKYVRLSSNQINANYFDNFVFTINSPLPDRPVPYGAIKLIDDYNALANTLESESVNVFDKSCVVFGKTYKTATNSHINSIEDNANTFICTQLFSVKPNDIIRCSKAWARFIYYNNDGTYVSTVSDEKLEHIIPSNVYYMRYQCANITAPDYRDYFMLTINQPMPATYKPFGKTYKVDEIEDRLASVEKEIKPIGDKAVIILDFDQAIVNNDNRIAIMERYGWKPTFVGADTEQLTKQLLAKGWDLSTYWAESNVPTDSQLSENSETALNACKLYVQTALASQERFGLYNPVLWSCRQNKYGETLGKALEFYGYKMARGGSSGAFDISTINAKFTRTNYNGIYSNNIEAVKSAINNAVANGYAINIFTHYVVDTADEDRGYDCLKSVYLELMDFIKNLESQNKVIVTNYHEFYQMLFPNESAINDNNRNVKRMNFIKENLSGLYKTELASNIDLAKVFHENSGELRTNSHSALVSSQKYGFFTNNDFDAIKFNLKMFKPAVIGQQSGELYTGNDKFRITRYRCNTELVTDTSTYSTLSQYSFNSNEEAILFDIKKNEFFIVEPPEGVVLGYSWNVADTCKAVRQIRLFDNGTIQTFTNYIEGEFSLYTKENAKTNVLQPVEMSWIDNHFLNWDSNAISENVNVKYSSIPVCEGEIYEVSGYSFYGARLVIFRDVKGKKISSFPSSNGIRWDKGIVTVPQDAVEMIVQSRSENATDGSANYKNHYETKLYKSVQADRFKHDKNIKWVAVGDSLTASSTLNPLPNYTNFVADELGITVVNKGISGTGYVNTNSGASTTFVSRIAELPVDANVVTFFGSFNDVYVSYNLGSITDTSADNTFYGKLKKTVEDVSARCPNAAIGFITPTPWGSVNAVTGGTTYETKGKQYVQAIIDVANMYSIPILDLFSGSNVRMYDADFIVKYGRYGTDSTHPNSEAHRKFIAPKVARFVETLIGCN